jgi:FixJ family two-component response regulator
MTGAPVVFVVDDDPSVRSSLKFLLSTVGLQVESFDSLILSCIKSGQTCPVALCWTSDYLD